jgi:hypothetical protein
MIDISINPYLGSKHYIIHDWQSSEYQVIKHENHL